MDVFNRVLAQLTLILLLIIFPFMLFVYVSGWAGNTPIYQTIQFCAHIFAIAFAFAARRNIYYFIGIFLSVIVFIVAVHQEDQHYNPDLTNDPQSMVLCEGFYKHANCEYNNDVLICVDETSGADLTYEIEWCVDSVGLEVPLKQ